MIGFLNILIIILNEFWISINMVLNSKTAYILAKLYFGVKYHDVGE